MRRYLSILLSLTFINLFVVNSGFAFVVQNANKSSFYATNIFTNHNEIKIQNSDSVVSCIRNSFSTFNDLISATGHILFDVNTVKTLIIEPIQEHINNENSLNLNTNNLSKDSNTNLSKNIFVFTIKLVVIDLLKINFDKLIAVIEFTKKSFSYKHNFFENVSLLKKFFYAEKMKSLTDKKKAFLINNNLRVNSDGQVSSTISFFGITKAQV